MYGCGRRKRGSTASTTVPMEQSACYSRGLREMQSRQGGRLGSDLRIQERQWKGNGGAGVRVIGLQLFYLGKISLDMEQGFCLHGLVFGRDCASEAIEVR